MNSGKYAQSINDRELNAYTSANAIYISVPQDSTAYFCSIRDVFGKEIHGKNELQTGVNKYSASPGEFYFVKIETERSSVKTFTLFTFESKSSMTKSSFIVFPNPFHEELTVFNTEKNDGNYDLRILDNKGSEISGAKNFEMGTHYEFDYLEPGLYIFIFTDKISLQTESIKIIKK